MPIIIQKKVSDMTAKAISSHTQIRKTGKRGRLLLLFFGAVLTFNCGALFFRTLDHNPATLSAGILESGPLYPKRAAILSADKIPLAWSENVFELLVSRSDFEQFHGHNNGPNTPVLQVLYQLSGEATPHPREEDPDLIVAVDSLTVNQLELLAKYTPLPDSWHVNVRPIRKTVSDSTIREKIGKTAVNGRKVEGISGWEKHFDQQLSGIPGKYQVFSGSSQKMISKSFQIVKPPVRGQPVILPQTYQELSKNPTERTIQ